jgi:membrane protein DedA with SNARE-associated domain
MPESLPPNLEHIAGLLSAYGGFWIYMIVFVSAIIENIFPPYPGDTVLFAGTVVSAAGQVYWPVVLLAGIVGNVAGAMLVYSFGLYKGRKYFLHHSGRWISEKNLHRIEGWFARHGAELILISRFLTGIRSAVSLTAGIAEVNTTKMVVYTVVSTLLWNGLIVGLALALGSNWREVYHFAMSYNRIVLLSIVSAAALWGAYRLTFGRRRR